MMLLEPGEEDLGVGRYRGESARGEIAEISLIVRSEFGHGSYQMNLCNRADRASRCRFVTAYLLRYSAEAKKSFWSYNLTAGVLGAPLFETEPIRTYFNGTRSQNAELGFTSCLLARPGTRAKCGVVESGRRRKLG